MLGIYKIEAPSGNFYIGSSIDIDRRICVHKSELQKGTHINSALRNAAAAYGVEGLTFTQYVCVLDNKYLLEIEQLLIDELKPNYNISKIADCALFDTGVIAKRVASVSKPIVRLSDGVVFPSGCEVARHYGIKSADNLSTAIKNGWKFAGEFWAFVGNNLTHEQASNQWNRKETERKSNAAKAATKSRSKQVRRISDGAIFQSASEASRSIGQYDKLISYAICNNKEKGGSRWEYV
jgi:group I intron endonuclease